jgi:hypothetical protein
MKIQMAFKFQMNVKTFLLVKTWKFSFFKFSFRLTKFGLLSVILTKKHFLRYSKWPQNLIWQIFGNQATIMYFNDWQYFFCNMTFHQVVSLPKNLEFFCKKFVI